MMEVSKETLATLGLMHRNLLLLQNTSLVHVRVCSGFMWQAMQLVDESLNTVMPKRVRELQEYALTPGFVFAWWHMKTQLQVQAVIAKHGAMFWSDVIDFFGKPKHVKELLQKMEASGHEQLLRVVSAHCYAPDTKAPRHYCTSCVPRAA